MSDTIVGKIDETKKVLDTEGSATVALEGATFSMQPGRQSAFKAENDRIMNSAGGTLPNVELHGHDASSKLPHDSSKNASHTDSAKHTAGDQVRTTERQKDGSSVVKDSQNRVCEVVNAKGEHTRFEYEGKSNSVARVILPNGKEIWSDKSPSMSAEGTNGESGAISTPNQNGDYSMTRGDGSTVSKMHNGGEVEKDSQSRVTRIQDVDGGEITFKYMGGDKIPFQIDGIEGQSWFANPNSFPEVTYMQGGTDPDAYHPVLDQLQIDPDGSISYERKNEAPLNGLGPTPWRDNLPVIAAGSHTYVKAIEGPAQQK